MNKQFTKKKTKFFNTRWKRREHIFLLERLSLYISSGMIIHQALEIAKQGMNEKHRSSLERVKQTVESGGEFAVALQNETNLSGATISIISHGNESGRLGESLEIAKSILEKQDELIRKIIGALIYPMVIGFFASVLTIGLVRGIMPQIIPMLEGLKVDLPLLTKIVMKVSNISVDYGLYIVCGAFLVSSSAIFSYKKIKAVKNAYGSLVTRMPIIGAIARNFSIAVFLRSCGSLVQSGIPITVAYESSASTISLYPLQRSLLSKCEQIYNGVPISSALSEKSLHFPSYACPLISAGESSGTLGDSLIRSASIMERDIDHSLKKLTSLIEPLMMVGMGSTVGSIALSIIMPIYDLSKALQNT